MICAPISVPDVTAEMLRGGSRRALIRHLDSSLPFYGPLVEALAFDDPSFIGSFLLTVAPYWRESEHIASLFIYRTLEYLSEDNKDNVVKGWIESVIYYYRGSRIISDYGIFSASHLLSFARHVATYGTPFRALTEALILRNQWRRARECVLIADSYQRTPLEAREYYTIMRRILLEVIPS